MPTNAMTLEAIITIICVRSLGGWSWACPVLSREDLAADPPVAVYFPFRSAPKFLGRPWH